MGTSQDRARWHFYPPCCVQPHSVCIPGVAGARAGESTDVPWVQPRKGQDCPGYGAGERLEGPHRALPQEHRVLSLAGSHGRQSCRCTRTASDIITILIMKGQLLQSSPSLRRRERGMQRRCVSLIPSNRGEREPRCPDDPSLVLHQDTDLE